MGGCARTTLAIFITTAILCLSDAKQPNIVFILADDYGYHDIGYHGGVIKTPVLDKLANGGVKLENYYVQSIGTPSRSQLLSGRYQIYTGLQHLAIYALQPNGLPPQLPTVADKLKESGYSTHMLGKWHLGFHKPEYLPTNRGFDTFFGFYQSQEDYYSHTVCGVLNACGLDLHNGTEPVYDNAGKYSAHMYAEEAEKIIRKRDKSKPMFLYLALQSVHAPVQVPDEYSEHYSHLKGLNRAKYAGMVAAMDEAIGNVTKALEGEGMGNDTIVIFSSDNGGMVTNGGINWPLRGGKFTNWEGGIRANAFVSSPLLGKTAGTVSKELMHISDWYPTLVGLANGSIAGTKLDGHNQWETISNGAPSPRTELLHDMDPMWMKRGNPLYKDTFDTRIRAALRVGHMKLMTGDPGFGEAYPPETVIGPGPWKLTSGPHMEAVKNVWLYNVTHDPEENMELSQQHPELVKSMLDKLQVYLDNSVPVSFPLIDFRANPLYHNGVWSPWL